LEEALSPQRVFQTHAGSKEELLHTLVNHLEDCGEVDDLEGLRTAIFAREDLMSTGIGLGIGVPHARISSVRNMILAVAINQTPLEDYESIDGVPVQIVFLVAGRPDQQSQYVRLLAVLSQLVKDETRRNGLIAADSPAAIFDALVGSA
jgi:PTS system nitrogen regulatory IIA component